MSLKLPVKYLILGALALLLIGAAVVGVFTCRYDREAGENARATQSAAPPGWVAPPTETTPFLSFKKNKASDVTAGFPAGSRVVVVETPKGETVEIGILPDGQVVTKEGVKATIYEKRAAFIAPQIRPFIGAGAIGPELGVAAAVGVDLLRVWRVNLGLGALINDEAVAAAAFAAYPVWRNVDARIGGGYGTAGAAYFAGVSIGIE